MKTIALVFWILVSQFANSQTPKRNISVKNGDYVEGDKITKNNVSNYNLKEKDRILNVSKYLDTTKTITVCYGTITFGVTMDELRKGFNPFQGAFGDFQSTLRIQLIGNKIKINAGVDAFDGTYIVRIVNNKIITSKSDFYCYASDKDFEVFDDYFIPVFQIEISKKRNGIILGGAFNYQTGYIIIDSNGGMLFNRWGYDKLSMTQHERDSILIRFRNQAKAIKPIHDE